MVVDKFQNEIACVVLDGGDVFKNLLQSFLEKPIVGGFLYLNQIGQIKYLVDAGVTHSDPLSKCYRMYH